MTYKIERKTRERCGLCGRFEIKFKGKLFKWFEEDGTRQRIYCCSKCLPSIKED